MARNDDPSVRASKFMSRVLRHAAHHYGLEFQPGGWVAVDDLMRVLGKNGFPDDRKSLAAVVAADSKQRFAFDESGNRIRANQGHSVDVDLQLEPAEPPEILYHGTVEKFLDSIRTDGLSKSQRHHVHLSMDIATAEKVGARRGKPVVLKVKAGKMQRSGLPFFVSANGVWLTDAVPVDFIEFPDRMEMTDISKKSMESDDE